MWTIYGNTNNYQRAWCDVYETNNATTYKIALNAGVQAQNWGFAISSGCHTIVDIGGSTYTGNGGMSSSYGGYEYTRHVTNFSRTYTKGHSAFNVSIHVGYWNDSGYMEANSDGYGTVTVPALASYTVSYNANGGSGAPGNQTKWYGENLTLSSTKPTRTGYTFKGWATSASGSVSYNPGSTYSSNSALALYAVWQINTWTVSYNANGGSGAPASQTKTYGKTLTLSSTKPTRTNYNFLGWATSSTSKTVAYKAGASYTANSGATLYAVWELAYIYPSISGLSVIRCDSDGTSKDDGDKCKISLSWKTDQTISASNSMKTLIIKLNNVTDTITTGVGDKTGSLSSYIHSATVSTESSYVVTVSITDDYGGTTTKTATLSQSFFTLDFLPGGKGIGIGTAATKPGIYFGANPVIERSSGDYDITGIPDSSYRAKRTDTGIETFFGIGSGGYNHGIYSSTYKRWIIYVNQYGNTYVPQTINGVMCGSWKSARDNAIIAQKAQTAASWAPVVSILTKNGNWSIGNLNSEDELKFSYFSNTYYNNNINIPSNVEIGITSPGLNRKIYAGRTLYSNSSGSNGTITLSNSAANWTFLEIYFRTDDGTSYVSSGKIYSPNGKNALLCVNWFRHGSPNIEYLKARAVLINGTTISTVSQRYGNGAVASNNTCNAYSDNQIYITEVIGYY